MLEKHFIFWLEGGMWSYMSFVLFFKLVLLWNLERKLTWFMNVYVDSSIVNIITRKPIGENPIT